MAFPVGKERSLVGELRTDSELNVKLTGDDLDHIESIRLRVWGSGGRLFTRDLSSGSEFTVKLSQDETDAARFIEAYMYDLTAIIDDSNERIIAKGKVTVV